VRTVSKEPHAASTISKRWSSRRHGVDPEIARCGGPLQKGVRPAWRQALQAQGSRGQAATLVGHLLNEAGLQSARPTVRPQRATVNPDPGMRQFGYINTQVTTALGRNSSR